MSFGRLVSAVVGVPLTAAALVLGTTAPAHAAAWAPTSATQVRTAEDDGSWSSDPTPDLSTGVPTAAGSTVGACNFLFSGPSLNPSTTPFRIVGTASYAGSKIAASTELSCSLREAATYAEIGRLTLQLSGPSSAVAGDIAVASFGPYYICTMVNVHFTDGTESNPSELPTCRPLVSVTG